VSRPKAEVTVVIAAVDELPESNVMTAARAQVFAVGDLKTEIVRPVE
jgi:hypothetical protein